MEQKNAASLLYGRKVGVLDSDSVHQAVYAVLSSRAKMNNVEYYRAVRLSGQASD